MDRDDPDLYARTVVRSRAWLMRRVFSSVQGLEVSVKYDVPRRHATSTSLVAGVRCNMRGLVLFFYPSVPYVCSSCFSSRSAY